MQDNSSFQAHWETFFTEGRTVIVPIDHGTAIPVPGLEDPAALIRSLNPFADGYVVNFGLGRACGEALEGKGVCFRTDLHKPAYEDNPAPGSTLIYSIDDGMEIGANAVMNMLYTHHPEEFRIFRECAALVSECSDAGLPLILESLPFGIGCGDKYTPENISFAVRAAAELGADVVKTAYPTGSVDEFRAIVDACFVPVVVLGGASMGNDGALFEMVRNSMDAGASGIAMGRNVWQHREPAKVARSLQALVHEDASVAAALKLMGDDL
jgi:DhnA family fructose-bisphosphate aldolase class Ia